MPLSPTNSDPLEITIGTRNEIVPHPSLTLPAIFSAPLQLQIHTPIHTLPQALTVLWATPLVQGAGVAGLQISSWIKRLSEGYGNVISLYGNLGAGIRGV